MSKKTREEIHNLYLELKTPELTEEEATMFLNLDDTKPDIDCLVPCWVDICGIYAEVSGDPRGIRAYEDISLRGTRGAPYFCFPRESIETMAIEHDLRNEGDYIIRFDGDDCVIEWFEFCSVHKSLPWLKRYYAYAQRDTWNYEKVWWCGYDYVWDDIVYEDTSDEPQYKSTVMPI